ncbi:MAG: tetratricopeptide repeat protein [Candidatus Melainabacteria bacterium]|nr:tetratricopeptide repeat protein [Candidatus Melainabacteria bacterium]
MADEKRASNNGKIIVLIVFIVLVLVFLLQTNITKNLTKEYSGKAETKSPLPEASDWEKNWSQAYEEINKGDYAKAEDIMEAVVEQAKRKGFKDSRLAAGNDCLAFIYKKQGKFEEAWPLYEKNLAIDEAALGKNNPGLINNLKNVALSKLSKKDYAKATEIYLRVVALCEKEYGAESPKLAAELRNLIRAYDLQGDYQKAKEAGERALAIDSKAYGTQDLVTAIDFNNLALVDYRLNLIEDAFRSAATAMSIAENNKSAAVAKVVSLNYQYITDSFEKPFLEGTPDVSVQFPEKAFEEAKSLKTSDPTKAAQVLMDNLAQATKAGCGSENLGKYLVRLNNVLFAQGQDYSAIAYGEVAQKILSKLNTPNVIPSLVNVQSYIAMGYDRQAYKALKEKNLELYKDLTAKSKENYVKAISLAQKAPAGTISSAWSKTIQDGLQNSQKRMKEYENAYRVAKENIEASVN